MEKLFLSIPPESRKYAARVLFPIIVAMGLIQLELVIVALAYKANFIELVLVFFAAMAYRAWYVHSWVKLEKWLLINDREFLAHFVFLRMHIGKKLYRLLRWMGKVTNRRRPTLLYWTVLLSSGFLSGLTGVGLKFGIAMIVVSRKSKPLQTAVLLGLATNTYIFLHFGPTWLQDVWIWVRAVLGG